MKSFKVGDEFREHPLSFTEGGVTVVVEYYDWAQPPLVREYDKIKNPAEYIRIVLKNPAVKAAYTK